MFDGIKAGAAQFRKRFLRTVLTTVHQVTAHTRKSNGKLLPSLRQFEFPSVIGYVRGT
jgi:hypothetical protein